MVKGGGKEKRRKEKGESNKDVQKTFLYLYLLRINKSRNSNFSRHG